MLLESLTDSIQHVKPEPHLSFLYLAGFSSQPPATLHSVYFKKPGGKEAVNICCPPTSVRLHVRCFTFIT